MKVFIVSFLDVNLPGKSDAADPSRATRPIPASVSSSAASLLANSADTRDARKLARAL